jgi:hypothetical protein
MNCTHNPSTTNCQPIFETNLSPMPQKNELALISFSEAALFLQANQH